jgi:hypothetical protein
MVGIYRTDGEWVAVYHQGHLFSIEGDWLGFVVGREVFDVRGRYLGYFSEDRRLLRARNDVPRPMRTAPPAPVRPRLPTTMPLAPLLGELPYSIVDVFVEDADRFRFVAETRPDMDSL